MSNIKHVYHFYAADGNGGLLDGVVTTNTEVATMQDYCKLKSVISSKWGMDKLSLRILSFSKIGTSTIKEE